MDEIMKRVLIIMSLLVATAFHVGAVQPKLLSHSKGGDRDAWVDSVFSSLTMEQRVGQLVVPVVDPTHIATAKQVIYRYVKTEGVGGLLFSKGSIDQYATLIDYAQSIAKVPLMITLDGEWGLSMRIPGTTRFPYNMGLGAIADENLLYDYGREVARQCKLMGITVNFAPVLDVNSNPDNPVIGYRSFGEDADRVARLGIAYSRGLEDGGVMSVSKHFPGHGDTSVDSHKSMPTIDHSAEVMRDVDLMPFRRYIDDGLSGVMVGHLNVPSLDSTGVPASMSHRIITDLLKNDMGFRGMVFTDALAMKGAIVGENNCVAALMAGADVLLSPSSVKGDIAAVLAAVKSGKISESSINERCRKMLEYKYALGLSVGHKAVSSASLKGKLNSPEADAVNRKLVSAMIACVRNDDDLLPVRDIERKSIAVVNIGEGKGNTFAQYCGKYADVDAYGTTTAFTAAQIASIEKHDIVIAAVYNDKSASVNALKQLKGCSGLVTVFFMNPYKMSKFAPLDSKALLLVGENGELAQEYGAQAVFGGIRVNGSLPVNVKGIAPLGACVGLVKTRLGYTSPTAIGFDSSLDKRVDSLVNVGLRTGAFPGCQVLVAKDGNVIINRSYGYVDAAKTRRVNDSTMYDIASVSKVAGTLPGLMLAYDEGLYKLDDPVSKYVEGLKSGDKSDITIRQMLLHESGLPASLSIPGIVMDTATYKGRLIAYRQRGANTIKISRGVYGNKTARMRKDITSASESKDFPMKIGQGVYVGAATRDTLMQRIFDSKLRQSKNYLYSDLNFALLMAMEEKVTGKKHDEFVEKRVYGPIGATRTCYVPLAKNHKASEIAPTEKDNFLRRQTVHGYVHDELAAFSGGVQGNAGLFSTANYLGKLCQMWLNGGSYGGRQIMSPSTVKLFTTTKSNKSRRWLGFDGPDTKNEDKTPTAPLASPSTYGHIGFTGTCFWVDPDNELIYVFLCNRVNPSRDNSAFTRLNIRPAIMNAVYEAMK